MATDRTTRRSSSASRTAQDPEQLVGLPTIAAPPSTNPTDPPLSGPTFLEPATTLPATLPPTPADDVPSPKRSRSTATSSLGAVDSSAGPTPSTADAASPLTSTSTEAAYGIETNPPKKPRWTASGDPAKVGVVIGGLIVLLANGAARLAGARGRDFRRPEPHERDAMAYPLARILCRHLPLGLIDSDLGDAMEAVVAADDYLNAGPLTWPKATELDHDPNGEQ